MEHTHTTESFLWSEASQWLGHDPAPGDDVIIPEGITVVLDGDTPELGNLVVHGTLVFGETDVTVTADNVIVFGELRAGSEDAAHTHKAEIVLTGEESDDDVVLADWAPATHGEHSGHEGDGGHGGTHNHTTTPIDNKALIVAEGGAIELHGADKKSWTQLDGTVESGATSIEVLDASGWQVGDLITIAPTGLDAFEVEDRVITGIDGTTISFDVPLEHQHFGAQQDLGNGDFLDMRAEVANLSRNITVRGEEDPDMQILETNAEHPEHFARAGYGGHVMFLGDTSVKIDGAEFTELGISGEIGRYAMHFHHSGNQEGSYVQDTSVHHTLQRGIVVHQTDNLLVKDNVIYDVMSHGIYLEDGVETGNRFEGNLVMLPRSSHNDFRVDEPNINLTVRESGEKASAFWITNVENEFEGNHAVGVPTGQGFWFIQPDVDTSHVDRSDPRQQDNNLLQFENNTAHTIMADAQIGFLFGYSPIWTGVALDIQLQLGDEGADIVGFTAWQVENMAIATIKESIDIIDPMVADVRKFIHTAFPESVTNVKNAVYVVKSDNIPDDVDLYEYYLTNTFDGPQLAHAGSDIVFEGLELVGAEYLNTAVARVEDIPNLQLIVDPEGNGFTSILDLAQDYRRTLPEALEQGDIFFGYGGGDTARGSDADEVFVGGDGNDTFGGYGGADTLIGGAGDDNLSRALSGGLTRNNHDDIYMGGTGDDTINLGGKSSDEENIVLFRKGDGNDLIESFDEEGPVHDTVYLVGYEEADLDRDGDGDFDDADLAAAWSVEQYGVYDNDNTIDLGDGDSLTFRTRGSNEDFSAEHFVLIADPDEATGRIAEALELASLPGTFAEVIGVEADSGLLIGSQANDELTGDDADNRIVGLAGSDQLSGEGGDDRLEGGADDDFLFGGAGRDTVVMQGAFADFSILQGPGISGFAIRDTNDSDGLDEGFDVIDSSVEMLEFGDGFSSRHNTDVSGNKSWHSQITTFDAEGELVERTNLLDDGNVSTFTYAAGQLASILVNDEADIRAWDSVERFYGADGELTQKVVLSDTDILTTSDFENGRISQSVRQDISDNVSWDVLTRVYDDGTLSSQEINYDNGNQRVASFVDGQRSQVVDHDLADLHGWQTITRDYDDGVLTTLTRSNDDGSITVIDYSADLGV